MLYVEFDFNGRHYILTDCTKITRDKRFLTFHSLYGGSEGFIFSSIENLSITSV